MSSLRSLSNASRILVTGGGGFLGKHLVRFLQSFYNASVFVVWNGKTNLGGYDLTSRKETDAAFAEASVSRPVDYVFHLAGFNGGIEFNRRESARIFNDNTIMGLNVIDAAHRFKVGKIVSVVASCGYPNTTSGYFLEREFLEGIPHDSVACHGLAKRNIQLASKFYRQQYSLNAVCVCPTTLYGPGDSFDPERCKVMGGMVKRFVDAVKQGRDVVDVWGSGRQLREFLYVEDAASLIVLTALYYDNSTRPLNLGSGHEVTIATLARMVADAAGYQGEIRFDHSKPDGQFRKRLNLDTMNEIIPRAQNFCRPLAEGIAQTVAYYKEISQ